MIKLKSKMQKQELFQIRKDMIESNKKMQEINERFCGATSVNTSSDAGMSFVGSPKNDAPPYTINYMRDRKERVERRRKGLAPPSEVTLQKRTRSNDNENSLPDLMVTSTLNPHPLA